MTAALSLDDEDLVVAARQGDPDAFTALVDRHQAWLTARCRHHLGGDTHAAEDVTQECLVALQRMVVDRDAPLRVRPWLTVVARNRCIDEIRKRRAVPARDLPEQAVFDPDPHPDDPHLARAWRALSERHRKVLELREIGGLSYEEIAGVLVVTSGAVEALLFRARASLRREYTRAGGQIAALAPLDEAVRRAAGSRGLLSRAVEQGWSVAHGPTEGAVNVVARPLASGRTPGGFSNAMQQWQARFWTIPGVDPTIVGEPGGGRLRSTLAALVLLLGGVAGVAGVTLPDVPPEVSTSEAPEASATTPAASPPAAPEATTPAAPATPPTSAPTPPDAAATPDPGSSAPAGPGLAPAAVQPLTENVGAAAHAVVDGTVQTATDTVDGVTELLRRLVVGGH